MSDSVRELRRAGGASDDVIGYVEAVTETSALGWVWCRGKADALAVELRHGTDVLARGMADQFREDLARSGVGSGYHAFSLEMPGAFRAQLAELQVAAVLPDGRAVLLGAPPTSPPVSDGLGQLQRGLDMLVSSHRLMHRNLQAALMQRGKGAEGAGSDLTVAQQELRESIAALEQFVVRIEQGLQDRFSAAPAAHPQRLAWISLVVAALALAGSSAALLRTLFGS